MARNKQTRPEIMEKTVEQAKWQILRTLGKHVGPILGMLVCVPASAIHIAAFLQGAMMDELVFGIYPPSAFFLGIGIPLLIASALFAPFVWDTCFGACKKAIKRRRRKTGKQAIKLLLKYRKAVISPQSSPRYLPNIELLSNQLEKLKLRHDACKTVRALEEHIQTLIPYLEEIGLKRTQKEVKGWSL